MEVSRKFHDWLLKYSLQGLFFLIKYLIKQNGIIMISGSCEYRETATTVYKL